ncbi:hypothetical protein CBL_12048 [Carabus blaptoides fortunei]
MTKTHGLSQAYGNMDNYDALGLFVKDRNKQTCGNPDCPYTNVPEYYTSNQRVQSISQNCGGTTCPVKQNVTNCNKYGAAGSNCGGTTCPYSAVQNVTNETNYETSGGQTCPYSDNNNYGGISARQNRNERDYIHCGGQACPHSATKMKSSLNEINTVVVQRDPFTLKENSSATNNCGGKRVPFTHYYKCNRILVAVFQLSTIIWEEWRGRRNRRPVKQVPRKLAIRRNIAVDLFIVENVTRAQVLAIRHESYL